MQESHISELLYDKSVLTYLVAKGSLNKQIIGYS